MQAVVGHELMIERAEGVWLWDSDGNRYIDGTASLWYSNVGHGRKRMADAIAAQIIKLDAYSIFGDILNPPAQTLVERLAALAPVDDPRVLLTTGGGDGIETAAKLARAFWAAQGQTERTTILSRTGSFHGVFGFGTSLGGIAANRDGFGPLLRETGQVAHDSLEALEAEIEATGPERVAAFFFEPISGAGGVRHPPPGYLEGVTDLCKRHGILLVCDAVICGFGRLGTWFGIERFGLRPDMIVFAKGVTSGYLPLGGVVVAGRIADPFWTGEARRLWRHGTTYAGHPTCCVAALTNIEIIQEEGLLEASTRLERLLAEELQPLEDHPAVKEVRAGLGFMAAVELEDELLEREPGAVGALAQAVRRHGVILRPLAREIALSPPLVCEPEHLQMMGAAIRSAVAEVADPLLEHR